MVKKILILLLLFLFTEVTAVAVVLRNFGPQRQFFIPKPQSEYDNPEGNQSLESSWPESLNLVAAGKTWRLPKSQLQTWRQPSGTLRLHQVVLSSLTTYFYRQTATAHPWTSYDFFATVKGLELSEGALGTYLVDRANEINRSPEEPRLKIEDNRATVFVPPQTGQNLDLLATRRKLAAALLTGVGAVSLPVLVQEPQTNLGDLNSLGIKTLLARGQTDFSGSSPSRIQNIKVGAARFQGLLIKPGEEFSFNARLGPIDAAHGYLPELVIKPEGTVPEFGGGLCQVSSTAFRAAFFTGLPITERRNHSYPVRYYEWLGDDQPRAVGLDATIYPGYQDLKFTNDTPGTILVWTKIESNRLYFDFYGTTDGREVLVDGPHPYDRQLDGAVKSTVTRTVIHPNQEPQKLILNSRYVSPNKYPRVYEYPKPATPTSTAVSLPAETITN